MEYTAEISIGLRRNPKEALLAALSRLTTPLDIPAIANQILIKPSIYDPKLVGNTEPELVRAIARTFSNLGHISIIESDNVSSYFSAFFLAYSANLGSSGISTK